MLAVWCYASFFLFFLPEFLSSSLMSV
jgi:hypothetical protein